MVDFAFEIKSLKRLLEAQQIATMTAVRRAEKADADLAHIRKREEEVIVHLCNRIQNVEAERDGLRAAISPVVNPNRIYHIDKDDDLLLIGFTFAAHAPHRRRAEQGRRG